MKPSIYLERYAWKKPLFPEYKPKSSPDLIIVLPSYREKDLLSALDSINQCDAPKGHVLIIVVINESTQSTDETKAINSHCHDLLASYSSRFELKTAHVQLPEKKAGVGLARKIGMDEAVRIFEKDKKDGVIICYDADCACQSNYLIEVERCYSNPKTKAAVVFYEHNLEGDNRNEITSYERYLRYYIMSLRMAGFPYAHQTLGSCITVRSSIYQQEGGMNTRKAGEDFYFLNKIIPLGGFEEINSTTIYPSDRVSERVPFGTGKSVQKIKDLESPYMVYNPKSFEDLYGFLNKVDSYWNADSFDIPESVLNFTGLDFEAKVRELKNQTSSKSSFIKRFFSWFDAFKILKYVHYAREHYYNDVPINEALQWLSSHIGQLPEDPSDQLQELRNLDRKYVTPGRTGH